MAYILPMIRGTCSIPDDAGLTHHSYKHISDIHDMNCQESLLKSKITSPIFDRRNITI